MKRWTGGRLRLTGALCASLLAACSTPERRASSPAAGESSLVLPPPGPPATADTNGWISLFDGKTLKGWSPTDFAGAGEVKVLNEMVVLRMGDPLSGVTWTNRLPATNHYEISLEAMKLEGSDFFCGLTFPVGNTFCTWILGGWGGGIVGLSSIDGMDASENETSKSLYFERNRWFHLRLSAGTERITAWIDDEQVIDVDVRDRKISMRPGEIYKSQPLGIATYQTTAAIRNIKVRPQK